MCYIKSLKTDKRRVLEIAISCRKEEAMSIMFYLMAPIFSYKFSILFIFLISKKKNENLAI